MGAALLGPELSDGSSPTQMECWCFLVPSVCSSPGMEPPSADKRRWSSP
uniref:Predicted protein n=1 Tax=Hordeum vulgare subsp. vulgare TaxID=112509 RepID=F2D487_HORVV|nr:predicted protein [Hordeum vulgare subsp. vulgare]